MTPSDQARYDAKLDKTGDCWEWTASLSKGYGQFKLNDKKVLAHRVAAWQAGLIPSLDSPLEVDHVKCQNKKCCNPAHLQAMTKREHRKKTHACGEIDYACRRGENNGRAKLTEAQAWEIHNKYKTGNFTQTELGEIYGVNPNTVSKTLSGKNWPLIYKQFHGIS